MSEEDNITKRQLVTETEPEESEAKRLRCAQDETVSTAPAEDNSQKPNVAAAGNQTAADQGEKLFKIKRQIEYYLSDDNLRYDAFFQKIISANEEGWMPFSSILSCKRIQSLSATADDIVEAMKDSTKVEVKLSDPQDKENSTAPIDVSLSFVRRTNNQKLPDLEERPTRKAHVANPKANRRQDDHHAAGCLLRIENIPEEAGWEAVKTALCTRLPEPTAKPQTPEEIAAGKKPFIEYPIKFVSVPNSSGVCYAHILPFDDDQLQISSWNSPSPLQINNQNLKVSLIEDYTEAMNFVKTMPTVLQKRREREIMRKKQELSSRKIQLASSVFASVDHLRKCLKEVMNNMPAGKVVNAKTADVLIALLAYHPNGNKKLEHFKNFKVDISEKANKSGDATRCFFVVREDGSAEDFSLQKCFSFLAKNPPFVQEKPTAPSSQEAGAGDSSVKSGSTEADSTTTTTAAAAEAA